MPLTSIGSYPPAMQEFITHWTAVNATLGATPLVLRGGYAVATLTADRTALVASITGVTAADNTAQTAAGNLYAAKLAIRPRLPQFRKIASALLGGTGYLKAFPNSLNVTAVESRFIDPLEDMKSVWTNINADTTVAGFTPPLLLAGGYTLAQFTTELAALRTAFLTAKTAAENAKITRKNRDTLLRPIEQRLKQYREMILGRFDGTGFVASLPALSPAYSGPAADMVAASGSWNATTHQAVLTWTPSTLAPEIFAQYQVRTAPPPTYLTKDEETISDALDTQGITTFSTDAGLTVSGATALFRVYVVTSGGREKGSPTVKVIRP